MNKPYSMDTSFLPANHRVIGHLVVFFGFELMDGKWIKAESWESIAVVWFSFGWKYGMGIKGKFRGSCNQWLLFSCLLGRRELHKVIANHSHLSYKILQLIHDHFVQNIHHMDFPAKYLVIWCWTFKWNPGEEILLQVLCLFEVAFEKFYWWKLS